MTSFNLTETDSNDNAEHKKVERRAFREHALFNSMVCK